MISIAKHESAPRLKVVIDRSRWLRMTPDADEGYQPVLLNEEGHMCCLGFCLAAAGVGERRLIGKAYPNAVYIKTPLPKSVRFLVQPYDKGFKTESLFTSINDDEKLTEAERESRLTEEFARRGVDVTFVDEAAELHGITEKHDVDSGKAER